MNVDKRALILELRTSIAKECAVLTAAARDAREAATHEEAKPENDKDTRAIEAAYLAGAQADRVRELERTANALEFLVLRDFRDGEPIGLGAIVELDHEGTRSLCFVAPAGGGMKGRAG